MALPNLSGSNIQDTYQRVLHTDGTLLYNGTGSVIDVLNVTASHAVVETTKEISSSYAETASLGINFKATGRTFEVVDAAMTGSNRFIITASATNNAKLLLDDSSGNPSVNFRRGGTQKGVTGYFSTSDQLKFVYGTSLNNNTGIVMDSAGRIGVGNVPNTAYSIFANAGIFSNTTCKVGTHLNVGNNIIMDYELPTMDEGAIINASNTKGFYISDSENNKLITFFSGAPGESAKVDNLVTIDYLGNIINAGSYISSSQVIVDTGSFCQGNLKIHQEPGSVISKISASQTVIDTGKLNILDGGLASVDPALMTVAGNISSTGQITASGNISSSGNVYGSRIFQSGENINTLYSNIVGSDQIVTVGTISTGAWEASKIHSGFLTGVVSQSGQIASEVTGAFAAPSASFSTRVTANDAKVGYTDAAVTSVINTAGVLSSSANVSLGNISASGDITASGDISASGTVYGVTGSFTGPIRGKQIKIVEAHFKGKIDNNEYWLPLSGVPDEQTAPHKESSVLLAPCSGRLLRAIVRTDWDTSSETITYTLSTRAKNKLLNGGHADIASASIPGPDSTNIHYYLFF